ncbi:MAG: hypothetical protein KJ905_02710 [Nanoarchaeota archaeon]|nr:hypothetical protein [Nanoarchaeota archaeon]MBU2458946.1 hypothetical protein [Nanoarchaeota archaeon]
MGEFIHESLKISFWIMIGLFLLSFLGNWVGSIASLLVFPVVIFVFIISIIHLKKYGEKKLAVTALVLSSAEILLTIYMLIMGVIEIGRYGF